jgi:LmbE family N-acetylglucosaminyl deacetylase
MVNLKLNSTQPLNIIALGAHCDDIPIGLGGTLLKLSQNYTIQQFRWVVFSSNQTRKPEEYACAQLMLARTLQPTVEIWSYRDGFLPWHAPEIKEQFEKLKMDLNPDLIFTHYRNDRHQDHRLINELTWNTWRNHLILEYEIPKYDGDLGVPDTYVEIPRNLLDQKTAILTRCYSSQKSKNWFFEETFTALARLRGMECASAYAEAFYGRKKILC